MDFGGDVQDAYPRHHDAAAWARKSTRDQRDAALGDVETLGVPFRVSRR